MKKLLQFSGLLTWLAAIIYGFFYLTKNKPNIITIIYTVLSVFGAVAIIALIIRLLYGKDWFFNLGKEVVVGNDLIKATERFLGQLPLPKKEATANFVGHLVYRFTRLGFIGLVLAMIPIWLLYQQNNKIDTQNILITNQNKRLDQQTYLQEAERRSSLVFLFSNIMDAIDKELKEDIGKKELRDLSPQLLGRIVALSNILKPYKYLEYDDLISKPLSPERGQLLVSLIESQLDTISLKLIYSKAAFKKSDLKEVKLRGAYLDNIHLQGSNLRNADLSNASLQNSNLEGVILQYGGLQNTNMKNSILANMNLYMGFLKSANLQSSDLRNTNLSYAILVNANLRGTDLRNTNLHGAILENANLQGASLVGTELLGAYLQKVNLQEAKLNDTKVEQDFFQKIQNYGKDSIIGTSYILKTYKLDSIPNDTSYTYLLKKK